MKLYPDKLTAHLAGTTAPVYLLHGDEPLQLMELGDALRAHASANEFAERQVLSASDDSDWSAFREATDSLSLFAERRLIELRMPSGKPGRTGGEVLKSFCANPPPDVLLIITSGRLDRGGTSSAWFKAIDKVGVTIQVWPLDARQLRSWLEARLRRHGLAAETDALHLIIERVEGNMLAAAQECERLALLYPNETLSVDQILAAVADSARYSLNDLVATCLQGDARRALRVVRGLADEATAPTLVLWALTQEIRAGARTAEAQQHGVPIDKALKNAGVWQNRAGPLKMALQRHDVNAWLTLLSDAAYMDRLIKGQESGDVWNAFEVLAGRLAGVSTLPRLAN